MIKEKLMKALKTAAAEYNGGLSADAAVVKAAQEADFNEKQAERLTEMFNTLAVLNKEKDANDPTGTCELASKEKVAMLLVKACGTQKTASASVVDYSFYEGTPRKTNLTIEARAAGVGAVVKAASAPCEDIPDPLKVSRRSLYKVIEGQIATVKSAAAAADDVVRNLKIEIEQNAVKIAKAIEAYDAPPQFADLFKAACAGKKAVELVSEYSTKVAESDGGQYARLHVFDAGPIEHLIKIAEEIESDSESIAEYEKKRDYYLSKAAEAEQEVRETVGLGKEASAGTSLADLFRGVRKTVKEAGSDVPSVVSELSDSALCVKIAELIRETGVSAEEVARLAEDFDKEAETHKEAAPKMTWMVQPPSVSDAHEALIKLPGVDHERKRIMNVRRSILLADLMANDPIIRDADPNIVTEAYKTMVMTSPRVSLDKAQVRAFLRASVNSVAISPNDAKVIADVDKGVSLSNIDRLTARDSSIKDSNI